jgi:DNA modification methylase
MFTKQNDVVLDPFAGYGSVPLVCEYFNRRWIGIEISKERFNIAKEIISNKKVTDIQRLKKSLSIL